MKRLYDKAVVDEIAKNYGKDAVFLSEFSRALLDIIREGLIRDGQVRLHQFGTFKLKWMKSRNGVNPSTGEKMIIQARPRVIFTPAKALKDTVEPNPAALVPFEEQSTTEKPAELKPTKEQAVPVVAAVTGQKEVTEVIESLPEEKSEEESKEKPDEDTTLVSKLKSEDQLDEIVEPVEEVDEQLEELVEQEESNANTAVADIQDEIEVLEQVVDILNTDAREHPVEEDNLEDSHKDEVTSGWVDSPVVEQIKEISELQYFKSNAQATTANSETVQAASAAVQSSSPVAAVEADKLDIDLTEPSETGKDTNKPWFAMAAAVVVLLATGLIFNALWTPSGTDSTGVKYLYSYYPENIKKSVEPIQADVIPQIAETDKTEVIEEEKISRVEPEETVALTAAVEEVAETESVISEEDQIIVSTEQYNEVKRASAEESVYFLERDHRLVNGDSLWRLAKKNYINPFYWPHIYQANHKKIINPDRVRIGRTISLPTLYGEPDDLTKRDKRNIAMGYYFNYLYHKQKGNPFAYFSLIGVDKFDADLLIEFQEEISRSDVNNLALLSE